VAWQNGAEVFSEDGSRIDLTDEGMIQAFACGI
jgi:hypothetical protein